MEAPFTEDRNVSGRPAATTLPTVGWYPNPADDQAVRWWDGAAWTERVGTVLASDDVALHRAGLFDYATSADSSLEYAEKIEEIRVRAKQMIRDKSVIEFLPEVKHRNWANRALLPELMQRDLANLILGAFNSHSESVIKNLRYANLSGSHERIYKAYRDANKAGYALGIGINYDYCRLRVDELLMCWNYHAAKKMEAAEASDRRAALREENKVQVELTAERAKLEKELEHYMNALASLQANGDGEGVERMMHLLEDINQRIADVDYRSANIRAGYVYVISNVGAFGGGIVKIGMTRRLEPMDRVKELSNASVPFRYDVHALFFSTDAVSVEAMLHRTFDEQRVNKINRRREFFYARPSQVLEVLREHAVELVEWTEPAAAAEYRMGLGLGTDDNDEF